MIGNFARAALPPVPRCAPVAAVLLLLLVVQVPLPLAAQARESRLDRVFTGLVYRPLGPDEHRASAGLSVEARAVDVPGVAGGAAVVSPHDEAVRYRLDAGVLRSTNGGASWGPISPDLTADPPSADPDATADPGGAARPATVAPRRTLSVVAESPLEPGLIWVGASDGRVFLTRDGGASWSDAAAAFFSDLRVRSIEPSAHVGGRAYLVAERVATDDPDSIPTPPLVFRTDDYGAEWRILSDEYSGLPQDQAATVLREDPEREDLLFVGTPSGVYVSFNEGGSWDLFQFGLPEAAVTDLKIVGRDLVAHLQGRGPWVMDEIGPLRQVVEGLTTGEPYLFEPSPVYLDRLPADEGVADGRGAIFDYLLPSIVREVRLEVLDAEEGRRLVGFTGVRRPRGGGGASRGTTAEEARHIPGTRSGVHRIVWDLAERDADGETTGRRVPPGTYLLRMTVDGLVRERTFEVVPGR
ncbi:MAG: hypothetical protein WD995_03485 [Gemmatimonadota bacterium]